MIFFFWNEWHEARQLDTTYIVKVFFGLTSGKIPNALLCQRTQIRADFVHKRHQSPPPVFLIHPPNAPPPSTQIFFSEQDAFRFRHLRTPSSHILGGLGERRTQPIRRHTLRCRHGCSISRHHLEHRRGTVRGICGFTENGWVDWQVSFWFLVFSDGHSVAFKLSPPKIYLLYWHFRFSSLISVLRPWSHLLDTFSTRHHPHNFTIGPTYWSRDRNHFHSICNTSFYLYLVLHPFIFCIPSYSLSVFRLAILVLLLHRPHLFTVMTAVLYTSSPSLSRFPDFNDTCITQLMNENDIMIWCFMTMNLFFAASSPSLFDMHSWSFVRWWQSRLCRVVVCSLWRQSQQRQYQQWFCICILVTGEVIRNLLITDPSSIVSSRQSNTRSRFSKTPRFSSEFRKSIVKASDKEVRAAWTITSFSVGPATK